MVIGFITGEEGNFRGGTTDKDPKSEIKRREIAAQFQAVVKRIYGEDVDSAKRFLQRPHPLLGKMSPQTAIGTDLSSAEKALQIVHSIEYGLPV